MVSKHARVRDASIVASGVANSLERYVPDLANWPRSWSIEEADVAIGRSIVDVLQPFLIDLLTRQLADKILRRHRDHLWMLGGEIIRRRHDDPDLARLPVQTLLLDLIEEDGGPLIWPRITESEQNSFDATCRKLYRFLNQPQDS
jgi:hypothetical protein